MRFATCFSIGLLIVSFGLAGSAACGDEPGLVQDAPAQGPVIKTDRGYMVPYTVTIPGSEATFKMVPIPGGTYRMGSPESEADRNDDEGPQLEVKIEPFWMAEHEVTWTEYRYFMTMYNLFKAFQSDGKRMVTDENRADAVTIPTPLYEPDFTFEIGNDPNHPAVTMSHFAARQYSKWLSLLTTQTYRLPTEAEWEYACRAGSTTAYSFGDDPSQLGDYAWYFDNSDEAYHDVATKKPNAWGLYDMHGNVGELCVDQYASDAYQKHAGKEVDGSVALVWTTEMFPHSIRGGGWDSNAEQLRSAARAQTDDWREEDPNLPRSPWWLTDEPARAVGFRLVRPLTKPSADILAKFWDVDNEVLGQAVSDRITEGRGVEAVVDSKLLDDAK